VEANGPRRRRAKTEQGLDDRGLARTVGPSNVTTSP